MKKLITALLFTVSSIVSAHANDTVYPLNSQNKVSGQIASMDHLVLSDYFIKGKTVEITLNGWCDRYSDTVIEMMVLDSNKEPVANSINPGCWQHVKFVSTSDERYYIILTSHVHKFEGSRHNQFEKFELDIKADLGNFQENGEE